MQAPIMPQTSSRGAAALDPKRRGDRRPIDDHDEQHEQNTDELRHKRGRKRDGREPGLVPRRVRPEVAGRFRREMQALRPWPTERGGHLLLLCRYPPLRRLRNELRLGCVRARPRWRATPLLQHLNEIPQRRIFVARHPIGTEPNPRRTTGIARGLAKDYAGRN